jgi:hypothetical protein
MEMHCTLMVSEVQESQQRGGATISANSSLSRDPLLSVSCWLNIILLRGIGAWPGTTDLNMVLKLCSPAPEDTVIIPEKDTKETRNYTVTSIFPSTP